MTKINRSNYRDFCKELDLSQEELKEWREMCRAMKKKTLAGDMEMWHFINDQTKAEVEEDDRASRATFEDWSDMVRFGDAGVRLKRAQLVAYRKWQEGLR